jgi:nucleotide-binding universal stress UspA family protein
MYRKIIVGLSLEHGLADLALKAAKNLADKGAEIIALHAYAPVQDSARFYVAEADLEKARKAAESELKKRLENCPDVKPVIVDGNPGRVLIDYASEIGADCVVVGSHKPGLSDYFLGSTAARVVRHAPCSVHVLR